MTITASDLFAFARDTARKTFDEDGFHIPLFLIDVPDSGVMPIGCPWRNNDEKEATIAEIRKLIVECKVSRMAFVSETWMAWLKPDEVITPPTFRADRIEAVFVSCEENGVEVASGHYPIIREKGKPARCGEWVPSPDHLMSSGRLNGLTASAAPKH